MCSFESGLMKCLTSLVVHGMLFVCFFWMRGWRCTTVCHPLPLLYVLPRLRVQESQGQSWVHFKFNQYVLQFWVTKGMKLKEFGHRPGESCWLLSLNLFSNTLHGLTGRVCRWHWVVSAASLVACQMEEGGSQALAAGRERRVNGGLCEGLEFIGSTTVHLHGFPRKQQTNVPMEVDLPRLRALEPSLRWKEGKQEGGWVRKEIRHCI